jgi:hypothetical protein
MLAEPLLAKVPKSDRISTFIGSNPAEGKRHIEAVAVAPKGVANRTTAGGRVR